MIEVFTQVTQPHFPFFQTQCENLFTLAYEASKRHFAKSYGPNPPVYILLSCGSMGGVCLESLVFIMS